MKRILGFLYLCIFMLFRLFSNQPVYAFENQAQSQELAMKLRNVIDDANKIKDASRRLELLKSGADQAFDSCKENLMVREIISKSLRESAKVESVATKADMIRTALLETLVILTFKPKVEAPVPAGFPAPTPVGVVEIKKLPVYRMAKVANGGGNGSFFTLFNHIKKNNIEMTAPVEMTMAEKNGKFTESSMAFLYQQTTLGKTGPQGNVAVIDTTESLVASIGMIGSPSTTALDSAKQWLLEKIKASSQPYEVVGELRVMGYNSPFMPEKLRYYEVQLALKANEKK